MSNICAGIGRGQMEILDKHFNFRRANHQFYSEIFSKINDVADGTSYVGNRHKDNERDTDGWTLDIKTRDTHTKYNENNTITIDYTQDVNDVFYLNALADKSVKDSVGVFQNVFNLYDHEIEPIIKTWLKETYNIPGFKQISTPSPSAFPYF